MSDFVRMVDVSELEPGKGLQTNIGETSVALFNVEGAFYALAGRCPHRGGPPGEGYVDGKEVIDLDSMPKLTEVLIKRNDWFKLEDK